MNNVFGQLFLYVVLTVITFLIFFPLYGLWLAVHPQKFETNLAPSNFNWEFEEVTLKINDGIQLSCWFVPSVENSDQVIIMLHGYGADKANLLSFAEFLHDEFNLVFIDFRYFGKSGGNMTTLGRDEQKDLEAAISYVKSKGFSKIGLMGFSFGGAVAILGVSQSTDILAVVVDSPYASLDLMGFGYYQNLHFLKYPMTFLTKVWGNVLFGIDADKISPERVAKNLKIPILLIHTKNDRVIPFENALRLQKALKSNSKAEFLFWDEGEHGTLSREAEEEYQDRVVTFFKKNL